MSAGDVYEGVFDEALACVIPRCHCCNEPPAIGDLVTVWSSNWRVDARILKCPKCNGVPPAFAKRIEALRGASRTDGGLDGIAQTKAVS